MDDRTCRQETKAETIRLTVRTQSSYGESVPSNVVSIPLHTFNFEANKLIGTQPRGTPVKPRNADSYQNDLKDEIQEKSNLVEKDGKQETTKPTAKPRQDKLNPPVPKARTKGKPVVWKVDVEEDDSWEDSNRSGGDSALDEDEQVEICNLDMNEQQNKTSSKDKLDNKEVNEQVDKSNISENYQKYPTTTRDITNNHNKEKEYEQVEKQKVTEEVI